MGQLERSHSVEVLQGAKQKVAGESQKFKGVFEYGHPRPKKPVPANKLRFRNVESKFGKLIWIGKRKASRVGRKL